MEHVILAELIKNKQYMKKVIPYILPEYFDDYIDQTIFKITRSYIAKYKNLPSYSAIAVAVNNMDNLNEAAYEKIINKIESLKSYNELNEFDWLVDETERFCQTKALENAVVKASEILENKDRSKFYSIKSSIEDALKVNFNRTIGIEYFAEKDIKERWDYYNEKKKKFKTHLSKLNYATGGGFEEKKLHVFFGDTHVGKTMTLTSLAAGFVKNGYDVLYVSLEMSREDICKLIDANYTDIQINELVTLGKDTYTKRLYDLKSKGVGRLFVEEFPTGNAGTNNIRALLDDLKYKKNFNPQIIIIDYLNLMRCDRYSEGNSYTLVKGVSEEVRGLGVEGKYCMISATQTNRQGAKSSDIEMTDTAESYGLPQTVDLLVSLNSSKTLKEQNILIFKVNKNRLFGITDYKFPVTTNFEYARLLDSDSAFDDMVTNKEKIKTAMEKSSNKDKFKQLIVNTKETKESSIEDIFGEEK